MNEVKVQYNNTLLVGPPLLSSYAERIIALAGGGTHWQTTSPYLATTFFAWYLSVELGLRIGGSR